MKLVILTSIFVLIAFNLAISEELNEQFCRENANEDQIVECIEKNIWNPCEEGASGSSFWGAQCGWAHNKIAENKIKGLEEKILKTLRNNPNKENVLEKFLLAEEHWNQFRKDYCEFSNIASGLDGFNDDTSIHLAYCLRNTAQEHAERLKSMLEQNPE